MNDTVAAPPFPAPVMACTSSRFVPALSSFRGSRAVKVSPRRAKYRLTSRLSAYTRILLTREPTLTRTGTAGAVTSAWSAGAATVAAIGLPDPGGCGLTPASATPTTPNDISAAAAPTSAAPRGTDSRLGIGMTFRSKGMI